MNIGDLGMTPKDVESNLQNSFQMAQAWDCVLLLDEADVFLADRSQDNIERNALVSGKSRYIAKVSRLKVLMIRSLPPGPGILRRRPLPHHQQSRLFR